MISLIKIELYKIFPNRTFWIFTILYVTLCCLFFYGGSTLEIGFDFKQFYIFPRVWNSITYIAHFFSLLLGVIVISLVTTEFSCKTIRYEIASGLSKLDFVLTKILLILIFCIISTVFLFILGLVFGFTHTYFKEGYWAYASFVTIFDKMYFFIPYFIQTFSYLSFALLVGIAIRRTGLGIVLFILYIIFLETIIRYFIPDQIGIYFPMNINSNLTPIPGSSILRIFSEGKYGVPDVSLTTGSFISIGYSFLFCYLSYYLIKSRDF